MKKLFYQLCFGCAVLCGIFFAACSKDDDASAVELAPLKNKTMLAYVIGDVDLWDMLMKSINELEAGWQDGLDGNLIVYLDHSPHVTQFTSPVLLKIRHDTTKMVVSEIVKVYPDQDPMNPEVMRRVLNDVLEMYPAKSQALMIATHGTGAHPGSVDVDPHENAPESRAIAGPERYKSSLDIFTLAELLPVHYEFILFHACLMGNVETAWALKEKCDYMVASSELLPGYGLPYNIVTPYFFAKPLADFHSVLNASADWYNKLSEEEYHPLILSVIQSDKLEALAAATRPLMMRYAGDPDKFYSNMARAYQFGEIHEAKSMYYDLEQIVQLNTADLEHSDQEKTAFLAALGAAVPLKASSLSWKSDKIQISNVCGLSCYIPFPKAQYKPLDTFFKQHYGWIQAAGIDRFMK